MYIKGDINIFGRSLATSFCTNLSVFKETAIQKLFLFLIPANLKKH